MGVAGQPDPHIGPTSFLSCVEAKNKILPIDPFHLHRACGMCQWRPLPRTCWSRAQFPLDFLLLEITFSFLGPFADSAYHAVPTKAAVVVGEWLWKTRQDHCASAWGGRALHHHECALLLRRSEQACQGEQTLFTGQTPWVGACSVYHRGCYM